VKETNPDVDWLITDQGRHESFNDTDRENVFQKCDEFLAKRKDASN